jgi:hypothetical protein
MVLQQDVSGPMVSDANAFQISSNCSTVITQNLNCLVLIILLSEF